MAATLTLGATRMLAQESESRQPFTIDRATAGISGIDVSNLNGSIHIVGIDGGEASITGEKIVRAESDGDARAGLEQITIDVSERSGMLTVKTSQPNARDGRQYNVEYEIRVPRTWRVVAANANGQIEIEGIRGEVTADVANGQVETREVSANLTATVANGQISGDVAVPSGGRLALTVKNGQIDSRVALSGAADCAIATTNGEVNLALAGTPSARLEADVKVGSVDVSDLALVGEQRTRRGFLGESLSGTIGGGAGAIGVTVHHGSVRVASER